MKNFPCYPDNPHGPVLSEDGSLLWIHPATLRMYQSRVWDGGSSVSDMGPFGRNYERTQPPTSPIPTTKKRNPFKKIDDEIWFENAEQWVILGTQVLISLLVLSCVLAGSILLWQMVIL